MSGNTEIAWTDATWNPVVGCTKVSHDTSEWPEDLRIREYLKGWNGGTR